MILALRRTSLWLVASTMRRKADGSPETTRSTASSRLSKFASPARSRPFDADGGGLPTARRAAGPSAESRLPGRPSDACIRWQSFRFLRLRRAEGPANVRLHEPKETSYAYHNRSMDPDLRSRF